MSKKVKIEKFVTYLLLTKNGRISVSIEIQCRFEYSKRWSITSGISFFCGLMRKTINIKLLLYLIFLGKELPGVAALSNKST